MKVTLRLRFHTNFGQTLFVCGNHPQLGDGNIDDAVPLRYIDPEHWEVTVSFLDEPVLKTRLTYDYILRNPDGALVHDWGRGRGIDPADLQRKELLIVDTWIHEGYIENAFYTKPFQQALLKGNRAEVRGTDAPEPTHTFKVRAPLLPKHQTLCLLGEPEVLGRWNTTRPVLLGRATGDDDLIVRLDLSGQSFPIAYKYAIYDLSKHAFVRYEDGDNRLLQEPPGERRHIIVNDGFAALPANTWRGAGVAIPVFSLRSEKSFGIGEFTDLEPLADWCHKAGIKLIQLLPINDTSATLSRRDSYPYSAISAFALHPIYLNLERMAEGPNRALLDELEPERKRLNALKDLDYDAVIRAKLKFIRRIFPSQKDKTLAQPEYRKFVDRNRAWLLPYAAFCYYRDQHGTADFNQWPEAHRCCVPEQVAELAAEGSPAHDEMALHCFVQWHLHRQLAAATAYARANGIVVKGDLPIGVFRYGADAWQRPDLYHMEFQAGAPPDPFSDTGQNWSFPTYNWPRMKAEGYAWWKLRLHQMSEYFDAYRIDHILGFFRIWSIPWEAVEGLLGFFDPAIPVDIEEFRSLGIWFDRDRYTRPHITDELLLDLFENEHGMVKETFLDPVRQGHYALKPAFDTQRKVEAHFDRLEDNPSNRILKKRLFDLISNVILFEVPGSDGRKFHFRFFIDRTRSFKDLPQHTANQLLQLALDYLFRRQESFWEREGLEKLPALKRSTDMLVCGEDLGLVPGCVPGVMKRLGLLSLEVQRMPKSMGHDFSRPLEAPYLSVVTPSTHDMSTIRGWWEEDREIAGRFYRQELGRTDEPPRTCEPWVQQAIIRQHLFSPAMWSIFQLQDLLGMDEKLRHPDPAAERINVPANPRHVWCYRMHLTLESLLQARNFNQSLRNLIQQGGRVQDSRVPDK